MAKPTYVFEMDGKKHILTFGLGFLDKLDQTSRYEMTRNGSTINLGVQALVMNLGLKKASAVFDIIKFGTMTNHERPTDDEIELWILDNMTTPTKEEKLFNDFLKLSEKIPGVKNTLKQAEKAQQKT